MVQVPGSGSTMTTIKEVSPDPPRLDPWTVAQVLDVGRREAAGSQRRVRRLAMRNSRVDVGNLWRTRGA